MSTHFRRYLILTILFLGFGIAIFVLYNAYCRCEWNTIAASLAVITAIIGAYTSQRILWKQEDDSEPKLLIYFDFKQHRILFELVIENIGGSCAYDVKINWINPLRIFNGENADFGYIPTIYKNQRTGIIIDSLSDIKKSDGDTNSEYHYSGEILYKTKSSSKKYKKQHFELSLDSKRFRTAHDNIEQEFMASAIKIPERLNDLNSLIAELIKTKKK